MKCYKHGHQHLLLAGRVKINGFCSDPCPCVGAVGLHFLLMCRYPPRRGSEVDWFHQILYFVSSRERPWCHWARQRIHAARHTSFMRQSRCSFLNAWENAQVARVMTSVSVVLEVRQSIVTRGTINNVKTDERSLWIVNLVTSEQILSSPAAEDYVKMYFVHFLCVSRWLLNVN